MTMNMDNPQYYLNREFSLLAFNERVLALANDPSKPLLERLRFLCICSSNLDEFFEIRVAGLKKKIAAGSSKLSHDGLRPEEIFNELAQRVRQIITTIYTTYNQKLLPALKHEHIHFYKEQEWTDDIRLWAKHYFNHEIKPIISPIALDPSHPLPRLFNKSLNFIVSLSGKDAFDRNIEYAVVHAPRSIPRVIRLPSELSEEGDCFVYLSSIIKSHIHRLFPGMEINGCYAFRLTRNSDLPIAEDGTEDLAAEVQRELFSRHYGSVVRLEIDKHCPESIIDFLQQKYQLHYEDTYYCDGPLNLQRFMSIIDAINRSDLKYPQFIPTFPHIIKSEPNLFCLLDKQDVLLHHPYESFDIVIDFVRQAAVDPKVRAIKQILYRTPDNSIMVQSLVVAARSGKEVTAVIELRARFDEESNLRLANQLHEAGVLVLYGVVGFKTHAKMTLIVRHSHGRLKSYVHLSTGNYHEETTKRYTDIGLLTAAPDVTADVQSIFQQLTGLGRAAKLKTIWHAPFTLDKHLLYLLEECQTDAARGINCEIVIKVNSLTDKTTIQALYRASQAGVKITLIVRGICCLKPGIKDISSHIRVFSIIGRFLEHHRVYYFKRGDEEQFYCASADLMERNLYHRIEVMFPILDEVCQRRIKCEIINNYLKDNTDAWELKSNGQYKQLTQHTHSAQETLLQRFHTEIA